MCGLGWDFEGIREEEERWGGFRERGDFERWVRWRKGIFFRRGYCWKEFWFR